MPLIFTNPVATYLAWAGLGLAALALFLSFTRIRLRLTGTRTQGRVIGYVNRLQADRSDSPGQMPRIRYSGRDGQREFVSRMGARPERWPVGTILPVLYRPGTSEAEIATRGRLWVAPLAAWLMALVAFAAAFGVAR